MSAPTDSGLALLRHDPDYRRYFTARVVSLAGAVATVVAMPVLVYRLSGSAWLTASVTAMEALPYVVFGLLAGALTDRGTGSGDGDVRPGQRVRIGSVPVAVARRYVPHVLAAAFIAQAVFTFFDGANFGALPVLVGRERVAAAASAVWSVGSVVEVAAPPLAATALAVISPANLLVVDALSFVTSALLVRAITRPMHDVERAPSPVTPRSVAADVAEGVWFLVRHGGVRTMTVVGTLQSAAGGGFVALMVVWADRTLGIGTSGLRFGILFGVWGIGGAIAAAVLPRLVPRLGPERLCLAALPASAVLGVATALAPSWQLGSLGLIAWGVAYSLVVVNSVTYRQAVTPEPLLGRVNTAGRMLSWGVGWTGGAVLAGGLAAHLGTRSALVLMAAFSVPAVLVAWWSPLRTPAPGAAAAAD